MTTNLWCLPPPPESVTVAPKTSAGEVQHDESRQDGTDDGEEDPRLRRMETVTR